MGSSNRGPKRKLFLRRSYVGCRVVFAVGMSRRRMDLRGRSLPMWTPHFAETAGPHGVIAGASRPDTVTLWKLVAVPRFDESTGSRPEAGTKHLTENSHGRIYRPRR